MTWLAPQLVDLVAVVAARVDAQGTLLEANAGFLRLLPQADVPPVGRNVARFFLQPGFADLAGGEEGEGHHGLLTLGTIEGVIRTLIGRVRRVAGGIEMLAEYDVAENERVSAAMIELHSEASTARQTLTHANIALKQREGRMEEASMIDALTGVGNRRMLDKAMKVEIGRARRGTQPLGAIMIDIDHFKRVNDQHGHGAGDKVLARLGAILREQVRPTDIVARLGGEEFVVLLPQAGTAKAMVAAERIRAALAAETIAPLEQPVTSSFGVTELADGDDPQTFLERADAALYRAKAGGRNRVAGAEARAPSPEPRINLTGV